MLFKVDSLSRDLSRKEDELETSHHEKEQILEQLRSAEHVRFDFEGSQENYRRQLAGMDSQLGIMKSRLEETNTEAVALKRAVQVHAKPDTAPVAIPDSPGGSWQSTGLLH